MAVEQVNQEYARIIQAITREIRKGYISKQEYKGILENATRHAPRMREETKTLVQVVRHG